MAYLTRANQLVEAVRRIQKTEIPSVSVLRGPKRVPEVNELRAEIKALGVSQLSYFEEGLDCIQYAQASRAAIVMGWTGFIDLLQSKKLGILGTHAYKQLDAMRDERNNCAHVQEYAVTPRIALGFYAKLITYLPSVLCECSERAV